MGNPITTMAQARAECARLGITPARSLAATIERISAAGVGIVYDEAGDVAPAVWDRVPKDRWLIKARKRLAPLHRRLMASVALAAMPYTGQGIYMYEAQTGLLCLQSWPAACARQARLMWSAARA